MAPKGKEQPKAKDKVVIDKMFGMKNKKGGVAKREAQRIAAAKASSGNADDKKKEAARLQKEKEKAAAEIAKKEAAELFKPLQVQKVPFGVDPKTVLCQFFKAGNCEKGKKCKFSHDLTVERRVEKKSLYTDTREGDQEAKAKDDMVDWDEDKLQEVIKSKSGNARTTTDKVCKYFIEAVENSKYGWFWQCPNGNDKCMYKHSLPPGFKLKTKEQRAAEKALMDKSPLKTLTLEDFLESERHKLTGELTPVTEASFAAWKTKRQSKKAAEDEARRMKEATGRAMFERGDWQESEAEESDDDDKDHNGVWNLEAMRKETEAARIRKEEERMAVMNGTSLESVQANGNGPGHS